ncbi:MAG: IclR family transcriptional regulator [Anaerolineales bacterium]|nr:IclR family transcriptional regulator [Anaerolineales bacterium]
MTGNDQEHPSVNGAQSVLRALDLLEAFPSYGPEIGLTSIATTLGLNKATAYRLLAALEMRGFVERCPESRKYRLGVRSFELGAYFQSQLDIRRLAFPFLREMVEQTQESAFLCIREGDDALCVERVEAEYQVNIFTLRVGGREPLHCGGAPRALLSGLDEQELKAYAQRTGLPAFTPYTINSLPALLKDVANTKKKGTVVSKEDVVEGIAAIGAPIYDYRGNIVGAISLSGLVARYNRKRVKELTEVVVANAAKISSQLGYREA